MDWDELTREAQALRGERSVTASTIATRGAQLLHRALTEMYIGEPEAFAGNRAHDCGGKAGGRGDTERGRVRLSDSARGAIRGSHGSGGTEA